MAFNPLERVTNLMTILLETQVPMTIEQIVHALPGQYPEGAEACRAAFERDKKVLRNVGVPIETEILGGTDAGKTAYRIDRRRYELGGLDLTDDERRALHMAVAASRNSDARYGVLKLGADGRMGSTVVADLPDLDALPVLREAAARRCEARFTYHGTPRTLHPYTLLKRDGFWYVMGFDLTHHEVRTFRVDRIEGTVERGAVDAFERPVDFDPMAVFPADPKTLGEHADARATVKVDATKATVVEHELGSGAVLVRHPDGAVEFGVPCANVDAFRSWLFGLGTHAVVIGPAEVRAEVVEWLQALAVQR
ncbi:MAG: putative proteasome accessory factor [Actinomycetota bacterium]